MYYKISSQILAGMDVIPVTIETDISDGLPMMELVGYLGNEVKEARERVRTALKNSGFSIPAKRITVNISPADIRKSGTAFDLPIALSLLVCIGQIPPESLENCCCMGELGLDGSIKGINGILSRVMNARDSGYKYCLLPSKNTAEAGLVDGIKSIGLSSLTEAVSYLTQKIRLPAAYTDINALLALNSKENGPDFSDLNGQPLMRRALEISAAGLHNCLLIGPPGAGKTMAARRLPGIIPPLSADECIELTKIYSIAGKLPENGLITKRPFISPHHTSTPQSLAGGGTVPHPGAVSLAHRSVLYLDELPEFSRDSLEILRQPLEDRQIHISRTHASYTYPADFLLIASMNPCRCGYYPDTERCTCSLSDIQKYQNKISGPILDRIDISVLASEISFEDLNSSLPNESSSSILSRVMAARDRMQHRYKALNGIYANGQLSSKEAECFCQLGKSEALLLKEAYSRLKLSARSYHRLLKTSLTIADLDDSSSIKEKHIIEALNYRNIDKSFYAAAL